MNSLNANGVFGRREASKRKGWKPGGWVVALVLAWLALLAVPLVGLYNLDAFAPASDEVKPQPWMPIYPPIL